jgi:replicative DNA helicase
VNARRSIPHDLESEEALLGACLISPAVIDVTRDIVTPSDFYRPSHRAMYETILRLADAGQRCDPVTVGSVFDPAEREQVVRELHEYQNRTPTVSAADQYANSVLHHSKLRALIHVGSDLVDAGYDGIGDPADVADDFARLLGDHELLRRRQGGTVTGFYDDIGSLDTGEHRDDAQPWIARGVLRRGQRMLIVARAGLGKSTLLRQLAFCAVNGVHPFTSQPTEKPRNALVVELEAGAWDITDSMRTILFAIKRAKQVATVFDLARPALLHRQGGLNIRSPEGRAALELAIQQSQPELVVMGPVKYLFSTLPGENYETAALAVHGILNTLMSKYRFALAMEAHFSRGDHGAPGGSERWVDWPDVGFAIHPPENVAIPPPPGTEMTIKQFRSPRDGQIYIPPTIMRGAHQMLPWLVNDHNDPHRWGKSVYAERYGATRQVDYRPYDQGGMDL